MDLIHNEHDIMSNFGTSFRSFFFLLENVKDFLFYVKSILQRWKNVTDIENGNFYLPVITLVIKLNRGRRLGFCLV